MKLDLLRISKKKDKHKLFDFENPSKPMRRFYDTRVNKAHFTAAVMASHFSGVLQLTDLDDFITPSQVIHLL